MGIIEGLQGPLPTWRGDGWVIKLDPIEMMSGFAFLNGFKFAWFLQRYKSVASSWELPADVFERLAGEMDPKGEVRAKYYRTADEARSALSAVMLV